MLAPGLPPCDQVFFSFLYKTSFVGFLSLSHGSALLPMCLVVIRSIACISQGLLLGGPTLRPQLSCPDYRACWPVLVLSTDGRKLSKQSQEPEGSLFRHAEDISPWELRWGQEGQRFGCCKDSEKKRKVTILHDSASASRTLPPGVAKFITSSNIKQLPNVSRLLFLWLGKKPTT